MRNQFSISISAAALLASAVLGGATAAQADGAASSGDYNTENGIHAAPSGHVSAARLAPIDGATAGRPRALLKAARASAPAGRVVKVASRGPTPSMQWLTLRMASLPAATATAPPAAADVPAAPANDAASAAGAPTTDPAPAAVAVSAPAEAPSLESLAPIEVVADANPAPRAASLLAPASASVAAPAVIETVEGADPAAASAADGPAPGLSEEDAVYRRSPPAAPAPDQAAPPAPSQPILERVRDEQSSAPSMRQHVAFPREAAQAASAFDRYMRTAAAIDAAFKSGQGVEEALEKAEAYDAHQLEEGMIAYGAMAAMQSPGFVYGVMDLAADATRRQAIAAELMTNPEAAARLPGAREAATLASAALLHEAGPVVVTGRAIRKASYDVQHQSWSLVKAPNQPGRLAHAKALSALTAPAGDGDVAGLLRQISTMDLPASESDRGVSPVVAHSLALAAVAILSDAGPDQDSVASMVSEKISADCLKMSKLNLFQCLSVAGPEYEDVYCLGQHAVLDTGQCVASGAAPAEALAPETPVAYARAGD